jgi:hypothetical protein
MDDLSKAVEKVVNDLARPIMVYRLARAKAGRQDSMGKGARKTMANAEIEIDRICNNYGGG